MSDERSYAPRLFVTAVISLLVLGGIGIGNLFGSGETVKKPSAIAAAAQGSEKDASVLVSTIGSNAAAQVNVADIGPIVVGTVASQYAAMKEQGTYTPEAGAAAAAQLGKAVTAPVQYKRYTVTDLHLSGDTSYAAMLTYRAALKDALLPLMRNKDPEIGIFAGYTETRDSKYLDQLRVVAGDYAEAQSAAAKLVVPKDAAVFHAGILNAMGHFGAVLQALADNAQDPITSTALLATYNEGEANMIASFNNLATYYARHPKP